MKIEKGYTFNDLLLVPKYSEVSSRSQVDLSVKLPNNMKLRLPILSANMTDVTGVEMARKLSSLGCLPILHRFDTYDNLVQNYIDSYIPDLEYGAVGASVGIKDLSLVESFVSVGCKIICVDVAHGHHKDVGQFVEKIAGLYPNVLLIAGNVATPEGANYLWESGADVVKAGIGGSGVCSTRLETGNGYPQLSALINVYNFPYAHCNNRKASYPMIIADGGISKPGDAAKALTNADLIMVGGMLAGTKEAPGGLVERSGTMYKRYAGSSTHKKDHVEGFVGYVKYKGDVENVIKRIEQGLKSACSYQGVFNLKDFKKNYEFVEVTNAGIIESGAHDLEFIQK